MNTRRTPSLDDVTPDQREALINFRTKNGPDWRAKLNDHWFRGTDDRQPDGGLLRQVRNQRGPSWLHNLKGED